MDFDLLFITILTLPVSFGSNARTYVLSEEIFILYFSATSFDFSMFLSVAHVYHLILIDPEFESRPGDRLTETALTQMASNQLAESPLDGIKVQCQQNAVPCLLKKNRWR
jgi:hypothetical protein